MSQKLFLITSESELRYEGTRPKVDTVLFDGAPAFLEKTRAEWYIAHRLFVRPKDTPKLFVTEVSLDASRSPAPPFKPHNPLKEPVAT